MRELKRGLTREKIKDESAQPFDNREDGKSKFDCVNIYK